MTQLEFITYAAFIIAALVIFAPQSEPVTVAIPVTPTYTVAEAAARIPAPPAMPAAIATPTRLVVPAIEVSTDLNTLSSADLRKRCTVAGVQWRNAHGQGKHLRKGEMIAALTA